MLNAVMMPHEPLTGSSRRLRAWEPQPPRAAPAPSALTDTPSSAHNSWPFTVDMNFCSTQPPLPWGFRYGHRSLRYRGVSGEAIPQLKPCACIWAAAVSVEGAWSRTSSSCIRLLYARSLISSSVSCPPSTPQAKPTPSLHTLSYKQDVGPSTLSIRTLAAVTDD